MSQIFDRDIAENQMIAGFTSWRVGGPARWFAQPSAEEVAGLLRKAREANVATFLLGRGSNVLISDRGFDGLVLCTRNSLNKIERKGSLVVAEGGASLPKLARFAATQGFAGFEFLVGIPGTVGGGVAMNAGLAAYYHREIADVLDWVEVVDREGNFIRLDASSLNFGYRSSRVLEDGLAVVRAAFRLEDEGDPKKIHESIIAHLRERKRKQPLDKPTAGSTFKSPPGGKGAGFYIEEAGLKGAVIGGARVSEKHANWIENRGDATADDIQRLIDLIRKTVADGQGVMLEPEIQRVGF